MMSDVQLLLHCVLVQLKKNDPHLMHLDARILIKLPIPLVHGHGDGFPSV